MYSSRYLELYPTLVFCGLPLSWYCNRTTTPPTKLILIVHTNTNNQRGTQMAVVSLPDTSQFTIQFLPTTPMLLVVAIWAYGPHRYCWQLPRTVTLVLLLLVLSSLLPRQLGQRVIGSTVLEVMMIGATALGGDGSRYGHTRVFGGGARVNSNRLLWHTGWRVTGGDTLGNDNWGRQQLEATWYKTIVQQCLTVGLKVVAIRGDDAADWRVAASKATQISGVSS